MSLGIRVTSTLEDLDADMRTLPRRAAVGAVEMVRDLGKEGNRLAKSLAVVSSGKHGKHYPDAFSSEMVETFKAEYGPDESKPQGGMKFEHGEGRQTAPHLDLNRSADVMGVRFGEETRALLDRLHW